MSTDNFKDVGEFHRKFNLHYVKDYAGVGPQPWDDDLLEFRTKFLQEELDEFIEGRDEHDTAKMADALVDLVYVALGTAHLLGLPWDELWDDVQRANLSKERAAADGSNSKRGSSFDVVKPEGWIGPDTVGVLMDNGWLVTRGVG